MDTDRHQGAALTTEHQITKQVGPLGAIVLSLLREHLFLPSLHLVPNRFIYDWRVKARYGFTDFLEAQL